MRSLMRNSGVRVTIVAACAVLCLAAGKPGAGAGKTNRKGRQGTWTFEGPTGLATWVTCRYVNGALEGECSIYWPNSRVLESAGMYRDGLRDGVWRFHDEKGRLYATGRYAAGMRDGVWEWRYDTGDMKRTGSYLGGRKTGLWTHHAREGTVEKTESFAEPGEPEPALPGSTVRQSLRNTLSLLGPTFSVEASGDFILASQIPLSVLEPEIKEKIIDWVPAGTRRALGIETAGAEPVRIFLFLTDELFSDFVTRLQGGESRNTDPFLGGFYYPPKRILALPFLSKRFNFSPGNLAHELVHMVVHDDFPQVPLWFDEGLAALYENVANVDGRAVAFPHERLAYLRERATHVPPLADLMRMSAAEFSNSSEDDPILNYALCRFVCYYLQEKGKLADCYRELKTHADDDPRGIAALPRSLGLNSIGDVQEKAVSLALGIDLTTFRAPKGTLWVVKNR
ncbi:MAG: hypothetical protein JXR37_29560 [Kiritimatiellae bacterium]|nr:hypothetical protein [Kiritimatiellia bacterium]